MKKLALLLLLLVVTTGWLAGCAKDPGNGVPATKEEVENDPAVSDEGNV